MVEGTVYVGLEKLSLGARGAGRGMTGSCFQIFGVPSGGREITIVLYSSRGQTQPVSTGPRDRVSAVKQEAFYGY